MLSLCCCRVPTLNIVQSIAGDRPAEYEWNIDAVDKLQRAEAAVHLFSYRATQLNYLRALLLSARQGTLSEDWREALAATDPGAATDADADADDGRITLTDDQRAISRQAAQEIAASPPADWHPHRNVGWRRALDAWHEATKQCLDDTERAETDLRGQSWMSADAVTARIDMDRDLATASYRAGLAAGGLAVEWYDWLIERVGRWPDIQRRDDQLDLMTLEPGYRDSMQHLPDYWA